MTWEEVLIYVIDALMGLVITFAIPYVFKLLKDRTKNNILLDLIAQAEKTVENCVVTVNQTFVDALKADGIFDETAAKMAFDMCKEKVLATLSDDAKKAIVQTVGSFDEWLKIQIESKVYYNKADFYE